MRALYQFSVTRPDGIKVDNLRESVLSEFPDIASFLLVRTDGPRIRFSLMLPQQYMPVEVFTSIVCSKLPIWCRYTVSEIYAVEIEHSTRGDDVCYNIDCKHAVLCHEAPHFQWESLGGIDRMMDKGFISEFELAFLFPEMRF